MSRTIKELDLGTEVWLYENNVETPYILIRKDTNGCVLLRALAVGYRRMNSTNNTVYEGCEMDNYLCNVESGFLSRFNANTLSAFISRSISTYTSADTECHYISRTCYLLSHGELFNSAPTALEPETSVLASLMIYKGTSDPDTARKCVMDSNLLSAVNWWLRSPNSATVFYYGSINGSSSGAAASSSCAFRPALNVAPATIVSAEGADKIYLLPDEMAKIIDFKGKVLETATRPVKALVKYTASNLQNLNVQVCNNYGDTTPVWENATSMNEVTFSNATRETANWQVGVRCYGESSGYGYFEEPIVLTEVE